VLPPPCTAAVCLTTEKATMILSHRTGAPPAPRLQIATSWLDDLSPRLRLAAAAWLHEHVAAPLTYRAYAAELQRFYTALARVPLDLDGDTGQVALIAQAWAADGGVSAPTHNKRLSAVSSFYRYAIRHGLLAGPNPIDLVKRRKVTRYARAQALDIGEVRAQLAAIDRGCIEGLRDYALLSVTLATGRRLAEIAGLRWPHVHQLSDGRLHLTWLHTKGDEVMYDTLPLVLSTVLLDYVRRVYGAAPSAAPPDAPVWISLSNNHRGQPLSVRAIAEICQHRLGTSKVHRLRHTFAREMEHAGAPLSEIQRRLGHRSPATTGIYLQALRADENPYAEELVRVLGVEG